INGQLVNGYDGNAGELGHTIIFPGGRLCNCGRRGCLEQYTSARGMVQTCIEFIEQNSYHGVLSTLPKEELGCKSIATAAYEGDPLAVKVFECTGYILGLALSNAVAFSSPEAIFLMGGPLKAGELLLNPLRRSFDENLLAIYKDKIKILESELKENEVAILGAAALTK
ncbi:MAG: ROK family protein, partial [Bacteroidales bacterium]